VLYHTLQTFVWKIDAKAAINAFCSLARLDTARLVQMAEPGQNSWEIGWCSPSDWAGAQVNMVPKIDIAGIGFFDSLQFGVCFQENEA